MPAPRKTPQDHKPKGFSFEHDGKTYALPAPSEAANVVDGRAFRDALLGGQEGQLRLAFISLEAVSPDGEALDALYSKPAAAMLEIVQAWFGSADLSGATLPQS